MRRVINKKQIFLSSPHMSDEGYEQRYIKSAFEQNFIAPLGENVTKFESALCSETGAKTAIALSSGTAAIHMALKAVGVGKGDLVFCQSLTFSATANPIIYQNAIPVFIDSDQKTWNMSPDALEKAFRLYPDVKAVIVVHLYGMAADMDKIAELCERYGAALIEDAAESLGTVYKGRYTGTIGTAGVYSFNGNKIITTSGGGMLAWNHAWNGKAPDELIDKVRFWATQSRDPARHYQHSEIGYNYRMSNILAGIGRGQLKVLAERIQQKQHIYQYYKETLCPACSIEMMPVYSWENSNCWLSAIQVVDKQPIEIIEALEAENIEARPLWKPMHMQPIFKKYAYVDNGGVAENLYSHGLCLPSDTKMSEEDLERVCEIILDIWK